MARRTAKKSSRGAVPEDGSRIRNEVAAIALAAFAVLSLVALFVDANATVTHWWRSFLFTILGWGAFLVPVVLAALAAEMWFGLLRRAMAAPIGGGLVAYTAILALLQHIQHGDPATGNGAGGLLGSALDKIASGALGDVGGPIALLQDGDTIEIDAVVGTLNVKLTDAELAERKTKWKPRATNHTSGALWKYAQQVGPAVDGAVTHPGGAHEKQCYADI